MCLKQQENTRRARKVAQMIKRLKNWCNECGIKSTDFLGAITLIGLIAEFWVIAYVFGAR